MSESPYFDIFPHGPTPVVGKTVLPTICDVAASMLLLRLWLELFSPSKVDDEPVGQCESGHCTGGNIVISNMDGLAVQDLRRSGDRFGFSLLLAVAVLCCSHSIVMFGPQEMDPDGKKQISESFACLLILRENRSNHSQSGGHTVQPRTGKGRLSKSHKPNKATWRMLPFLGCFLLPC